MHVQHKAFSLASVVLLGAVALFAISNFSDHATAQRTQDQPENHQPTARGGDIPVLSRQPSPAAREALLDPADTVILLLDHQTGLFQTVKDVPVAELRTNAAHATFVPRKGEISAWDNEDFVRTVKATGRKTLVIAGVWTSVCVAFPALQAKAEGYDVYFVTDASGDPSVMASQTTIARMSQAGIVPVSTNAVFCEVQRTWNRSDAAQYAELYAMYAPNYGAAMESYQRAQDAALKSKR
jgi:nicotinamidase-related amidase